MVLYNKTIYIHIGHYGPSVRITTQFLTSPILCVFILYISGGTYSLNFGTKYKCSSNKCISLVCANIANEPFITSITLNFIYDHTPPNEKRNFNVKNLIKFQSHFLCSNDQIRIAKSPHHLNTNNHLSLSEYQNENLERHFRINFFFLSTEYEISCSTKFFRSFIHAFSPI